ncbi:hypothetical protein ACFOOK_26375 [Micromonospora krabiensis]|uniref:Uncharacterized protein n=1 Tax=Micromonospora krabiensis TaxID=307121 RepID=A0A1C3N5T5_9ACTN|nr:hypothetical protein [Micromonospora krabiensis]SBV27906.1 hypothetical protein GA0070620_3437 [Micromonospora krabiensis]
MTTTTTINFDLLDAAIEDAANEAHGFKHRQGEWLDVVDPFADMDEPTACGTAMCLAGFAAVRAGAEIPKPQWNSACQEWEMPYWDLDPETGRLDEDGVTVARFARERLGLDEDQADALFSGSNTLPDLRAMRDHLREYPDATYGDLMAVRYNNL